MAMGKKQWMEQFFNGFQSFSLLIFLVEFEKTKYSLFFKNNNNNKKTELPKLSTNLSKDDNI